MHKAPRSTRTPKRIPPDVVDAVVRGGEAGLTDEELHDVLQVGSPGAPKERPPKLDFPLVALGASAGGLGAFEAFFSGLPDGQAGMAFVLVQHLAPDHASILASLLARYTELSVHEAVDGIRVQPDCVYVIPPGRDMALHDGALRLFLPAQPRGIRTTIDFFFRTLAEELGERAICIILSGTGSDGTQGVRMVKGEGGMVMVQAPDTTEFDGMPRSALSTGLVDYVLPPDQMMGALRHYVDHAFGDRRSRAATPSAVQALPQVVAVLRHRTTHDFSQYKESTVLRRLERRMVLHRLEKVEAYLDFLKTDPQEVDALFHDLLIGVTAFFRDREAFLELRRTVIPALLDGREPGGLVRVWVCGCSTGEEAYSLAILLRHHLEEHRLNLRVQVFATDIDRMAIDTARKGVYATCHVPDIPEEFLARFFTRDLENGTLLVNPSVRDMLVFSEQDVIKDPPLSRMDLITCRNVMIYMNVSLQRKIIPLFHYALNAGGILFLGSSETLGENGPMFQTVHRKHKLFRRREGILRVPELPPMNRPAREMGLRGRGEDRAGPLRLGDPRLGYRSMLEQALVNHYLQSALLTDDRGDILHVLGRCGAYLEPAQGDAAFNVLAMARPGLKSAMLSAFQEASRNKGQVGRRSVPFRPEGAPPMRVGITVRALPPSPILLTSPDHFLVVLEEEHRWEAHRDREAPPDPPQAPVEALVAALEDELRTKDAYIQTTLEEMATSNEELNSANEELQSINEEMSSANEELETSKEELQSVNEELGTVNAELQNKVAELSQAYSDINSLLSGTGVGILVVDRQLRIVRFTPALAQLINLVPGDVGRPLKHLSTNLVGPFQLDEEIRRVLATGASADFEVQARKGAWYLLHLRPSPPLDPAQDGVVVTCVDISCRRQVETDLGDWENQLTALNEAGFGVFRIDHQSGRTFLSAHLRAMLGLAAGREFTAEELSALLHPEGARLLPADRDETWSTSYAAGADRRVVTTLGRVIFEQTPEARIPVRESGICTTTLDGVVLTRQDGPPAPQGEEPSP
ncbi:chemotaxis protein CheB [Mesoterricola silvestris]|uniref:protein-glutamate O-methyltransferase n=1 Tax=Mesoterricola silvestris TaxID=2927979 RepID=A0AA48GLV2_9BACT|nr:chemotaxis protein CheB [Mesoterricola silvestris]BDU71860.1 chemotaxis protein CheR [Mesoterricola silvestris]